MVNLLILYNVGAESFYSSTVGRTKDLVTVATGIVIVAHIYYVVKLIMQLTYIYAAFTMELITRISII